MLSYDDALAKTGCENVETTVLKQRILFAGFMARVGNDRLPKRMTFGELEVGGVTWEGKNGTGWVVSNAIYHC